jgi:predicted dienelactone hydrolase
MHDSPGKRQQGDRMKGIRVSTIALLMFASLGAMPAEARVPADPAGAGRYAVGRQSFTLTDPAPGRGGPSIMFDVFHPARIPRGAVKSSLNLVFTQLELPDVYADVPFARGKFPIVVFSHGSQTFGLQSYTLLRQLASYGFIVVTLTHGGDSVYDVVFNSASPCCAEIIKDRYADVEFALDVALWSYHSHHNGWTGLWGHSFGSWTALAVAGGFTNANLLGGPVDLAPDPRIDAIVLMGPAVFPAFVPDGEAGARLPEDFPVLIVGGTVDQITPTSLAQRVWDEAPGSRKFWLEITRADHGNPSNVCDFRDAFENAPNPVPESLLQSIALTATRACDPAITLPPPFVNIIAGSVIVPFFEKQLKGNDAMETWLSRGRVNRWGSHVRYRRCSPALGTCDR